MSNLALLKIWQRLRQAEGSPFPETPNVQNRHLMSKRVFPVSTNAGFTLIEMIVVVIIIAILSAIAAPGWLAFVNRQRVSKVNDAVFSALQKAQQEAKSKKVSYSVSFYTKDGLPQFAVYQTPTDPNFTPTWNSLSGNLEIKPNQVILGTNLSGENKGGETATVNYSITSPDLIKRITFDYQGNVPIEDSSKLPLVIAVAVPQSNSSIQPIPDTKRCVIVATLLGSIKIGQGEYNKTSNPQGCQ